MDQPFLFPHLHRPKHQHGPVPVPDTVIAQFHGAVRLVERGRAAAAWPHALVVGEIEMILGRLGDDEQEFQDLAGRASAPRRSPRSRALPDDHPGLLINLLHRSSHRPVSAHPPSHHQSVLGIEHFPRAHALSHHPFNPDGTAYQVWRSLRMHLGPLMSQGELFSVSSKHQWQRRTSSRELTGSAPAVALASWARPEASQVAAGTRTPW